MKVRLIYSTMIQGVPKSVFALEFDTSDINQEPIFLAVDDIPSDQWVHSISLNNIPYVMKITDDKRESSSQEDAKQLIPSLKKLKVKDLTLKEMYAAFKPQFQKQSIVPKDLLQRLEPKPAMPLSATQSAASTRKQPALSERPTAPPRWPFGPWQTVFIMGSAAFCLWMLGGIIVSALVLSGVGVPAGLLFAFLLTTKATHALALSGLIGNAVLLPLVGGLSAFYTYCMYKWNQIFNSYDNTSSFSNTHDTSPPAPIFEDTFGEKPRPKGFNLLDSLRNCCGGEHSPDESEAPLIAPPIDAGVPISPTSA